MVCVSHSPRKGGPSPVEVKTVSKGALMVEDSGMAAKEFLFGLQVIRVLPVETSLTFNNSPCIRQLPRNRRKWLTWSKATDFNFWHAWDAESEAKYSTPTVTDAARSS